VIVLEKVRERKNREEQKTMNTQTMSVEEVNKKFDHHAMHYSLYRKQDDTVIIFSILPESESDSCVRITKYTNTEGGSVLNREHTFYENDLAWARELWDGLVRVGYIAR
jgi:hypothetical protein